MQSKLTSGRLKRRADQFAFRVVLWPAMKLVSNIVSRLGHLGGFLAAISSRKLPLHALDSDGIVQIPSYRIIIHVSTVEGKLVGTFSSAVFVSKQLIKEDGLVLPIQRLADMHGEVWSQLCFT